jgi:hypothetical protein
MRFDGQASVPQHADPDGRQTGKPPQFNSTKPSGQSARTRCGGTTIAPSATIAMAITLVIDCIVSLPSSVSSVRSPQV